MRFTVTQLDDLTKMLDASIELVISTKQSYKHIKHIAAAMRHSTHRFIIPSSPLDYTRALADLALNFDDFDALKPHIERLREDYDLYHNYLKCTGPSESVTSELEADFEEAAESGLLTDHFKRQPVVEQWVEQVSATVAQIFSDTERENWKDGHQMLRDLLATHFLVRQLINGVSAEYHRAGADEQERSLVGTFVQKVRRSLMQHVWQCMDAVYRQKTGDTEDMAPGFAETMSAFMAHRFQITYIKGGSNLDGFRDCLRCLQDAQEETETMVNNDAIYADLATLAETLSRVAPPETQDAPPSIEELPWGQVSLLVADDEAQYSALFTTDGIRRYTSLATPNKDNQILKGNDYVPQTGNRENTIIVPHALSCYRDDGDKISVSLDEQYSPPRTDSDIAQQADTLRNIDDRFRHALLQLWNQYPFLSTASRDGPFVFIQQAGRLSLLCPQQSEGLLASELGREVSTEGSALLAPLGMESEGTWSSFHLAGAEAEEAASVSFTRADMRKDIRELSGLTKLPNVQWIKSFLQPLGVDIEESGQRLLLKWEGKEHWMDTRTTDAIEWITFWNTVERLGIPYGTLHEHAFESA